MEKDMLDLDKTGKGWTGELFLLSELIPSTELHLEISLYRLIHIHLLLQVKVFWIGDSPERGKPLNKGNPWTMRGCPVFTSSLYLQGWGRGDVGDRTLPSLGLLALRWLCVTVLSGAWGLVPAFTSLGWFAVCLNGHLLGLSESQFLTLLQPDLTKKHYQWEVVRNGLCDCKFLVGVSL